MRIYILVCFILLLISCTDYQEVHRLKVENNVLTTRVASLEDSLRSCTAIAHRVSVKNRKQKKGKIVNSSNLFGNNSNYVAASKPVRKRTLTSSVSYGGQCQAITKKGYQCSRRARSGGYCWQHGG